jgi:hypothetical protein
MKKKLLIFLIIPLFATGAYFASWLNMGNTLQRSVDGFNYRTALGSPGFVYWYQKSQVDSLFQHVPLQSLGDSSGNTASTKWVKQLSASLTLYLSPLYFAHTGASGDPLTVINSDSLAHHAPSYYSNYVNLTNKPTIYTFGGLTSQYTDGTGAYQTFPTNVSSFTNDAGYATVTQVKASFNGAYFGQTGSLSDAGHYANQAGSDNTFTVSAWVNLLSVSSDSLKVVVTWTDGHGTSQSTIMQGYKVNLSTGNMGTVRSYALQTVGIRAEASTTIQVSTVVSGAGSILYEVGSVIEKKIGNGGL